MFGRNIHRLAWTVILLSLGFLVLRPARAAVPLNPPETFFTNIADRLLQQQLGLRLSEVQIAPSNQYDAAVHRIFQVTANIYDVTTTNAFPTVFRPLFETRSNGVFLAGFTNDASVSTLPVWLESNPYGVPMVIAARKGIPNFNEFTIRSDITAQRKLQVVRNSSAPGSHPTGTNQMYVVGLSNYFGAESWNSYYENYPAAVQLTASNITTLRMANDLGVQTNTVASQSAFRDVGANQWQGAGDPWSNSTNSFLLALNTNQIFLSNAVYHFSDNQFGNTATNNFETFTGFALPNWQLTISNRFLYLMSDGDRILDFVVLNASHSVDLFRQMIASPDPYYQTSTSPGVSDVWLTNRYGAAVNGPTIGIAQQMNISLGNNPTSNADWRSFALTQTATENDKNAAIDSFRIFCGLAPLYSPSPLTNNGLALETPFNPRMKLSFVKTWQANDPMVHHHLRDLSQHSGTNFQFLKPTQVGTNISPSSLGRLNPAFNPWGGAPFGNQDITSYARELKDPGVYTSDNWNFPRNAPLAPSWLGRIHRGTPWQTLYLKADVALALKWPILGYDVRSHPTNDWKLAGLLATLFSTNDVRALTSINTTNFNAWNAVLAGLTVVTNDLETPAIGEPPHFETNTMTFGSSQVSTIVSGIDRTRTSQSGQYFPDLASFLGIYELSTASPFLNLEDPEQVFWGLNDEAYEMIPSQLLSRVRADPVARVARRADGLEVRFTVFDGYAYRVEGSVDGTAWNTVSEPHYSTNGTFIVQVPASETMRFFRAVLR